MLALGLGIFISTTAEKPSSVLWTFIAEPDPSIHADSLVGYDDGFAFLTAPRALGVTVWTSTSGLSWSSRSFGAAASRLIAGAGDLWAFGSNWIELLEPAEEQVFLDFPLLVRAGYGSGRAGVAAGPRGMVGQAFSGDVYWSDGRNPFQRVVASPAWGEATGMPSHGRCDPLFTNSVDVPPLVATDDGFYTLISVDGGDPFGMWPVCEPEVWRSGDGRHWERVSSGSAFGEGAFVYDLAWRNGTLVAVGGLGWDDPALWVSVGGQTWDRLGSLPGEGAYQLREVAAGELGWVILGDRTGRAGGVGWVSPDAHCWMPLPDNVAGREAAVGQDRFVIAEQGRFPLIWVGVASGGRSLGCPR